ncbi:MAG TPA: TonB family protein [Pyrinomonadaceae bacterium]|nr:TonB family protein [Pyrinomonadaceae bacterium]
MSRPHLLNWSLLILVVCCLFQAPRALGQSPPARYEERERGIELYRQNQIDQAIDWLKRATKKNKADIEAWYFLGLAFVQKGNLKEATKSFETSLKVKPTFAAGHAGLAYALLLRDKTSEATRAAHAAVKLDPNLIDPHYILGAVQLKVGEYDNAIKSAETAIRINPKFAPAYLLKSRALVSFNGAAIVRANVPRTERLTRYREAADALHKFLELSPETEETKTWQQQLASLRFYAGTATSAYSGREVSTKARILNKPEPQYSDIALRKRIHGTVVLRAIFADDGKVKHILIVSGLPYGLTEAAVRAASHIRFVPATLDGVPVSMFIQLEYNFNYP